MKFLLSKKLLQIWIMTKEIMLILVLLLMISNNQLVQERVIWGFIVNKEEKMMRMLEIFYLMIASFIAMKCSWMILNCSFRNWEWWLLLRLFYQYLANCYRNWQLLRGWELFLNKPTKLVSWQSVHNIFAWPSSYFLFTKKYLHLKAPFSLK